MLPRNLSEQLLHRLGKKIIDGELKPGDVLPKVEDLSQLHGVSRTVVREAIKGLTARRLVESSTKIGTIVRDRSDWQWWDPDVIGWASHSKDSKKVLLELTEVRLAIEPAVVELAAQKASDSDLDYIRKCYKKLEASFGNEEEWAKADTEFHNSIFLASHNELMLSLITILKVGLVQSRIKTIRSIPQEEALQRHRELMEAVCARNGELARERMYELLKRVNQVIEQH